MVTIRPIGNAFAVGHTLTANVTKHCRPRYIASHAPLGRWLVPLRHQDPMANPIALARQQVEFGDFQTPSALARQVCRLLVSHQITPATIVEPTCGKGMLLEAALQAFPQARDSLGVELNPRYVAAARQRIAKLPGTTRCRIDLADFFCTDWPTLLKQHAEPLLIIGNPPWVTNAELGRLGSSNLPEKSNFQGHTGWDALTGKSNFDISEWMLIRLLESLQGRTATLALLCKTTIARKVLAYAWKQNLSIRKAELHRIDTRKHFAAAVDACLLVCFLEPNASSRICTTYHLDNPQPGKTFGIRDDMLVSDDTAYTKWHHLIARRSIPWRSGIKHDCSRVMELIQDHGSLINGFGENVNLEDTYLYPLLKSSDLNRVSKTGPVRRLIVPQRKIGEDTSSMESRAPKTWTYLCQHADLLAGRRSSIYRNRPIFSIFGVGSYSFAPWKIAISGFYKSLQFSVAGPCHGKPTVVDDTVYFLPCQSKQEATLFVKLLHSDPAREYLSSLIFWDAKRPVTGRILGRLDLLAVANELQLHAELKKFAKTNPWISLEHAEPVV